MTPISNSATATGISSWSKKIAQEDHHAISYGNHGLDPAVSCEEGDGDDDDDDDDGGYDYAPAA